MIKCNWDPNFLEKLTFEDSSHSWTAEDLSVSQASEEAGSLELNVGVSETVCTCRTIELFSSTGYLKSIRGNLVQDDSYKLYKHEIEPKTVKELAKVKFLSNSHSPKTTVFFRKLVLTAGAVLPSRKTTQINTATVRELLKDLPHNERSSASVLSMMDNMPPLLSMMLPNARLPSQLTELSRPPLQQSGSPDQRPVLEDERSVNQTSVKFSHETRSTADKAPLDLSSILGSIGSIDEIASITDMLKRSNQSSSDNQNQSPNNQPTQNITSDLKRIHHEQKAIRDDISKLRKELSDTRKEVLQAVSDSESRTSELLHRILEELEECKTS